MRYKYVLRFAYRFGILSGMGCTVVWLKPMPAAPAQQEKKMSDNNGGPAFPTSHSPEYPNEIGGGLSLRDYFAAKAMAPMVQNRMVGSSQYGNEVEIAARAYEIADAMIRARGAA